MRQAASQMHLSRSDSDCRGALKIAVIVNEVGSIDVDSLLVNLKQVQSSTFCYARLVCLKKASLRPLQPTTTEQRSRRPACSGPVRRLHLLLQAGCAP